MSKRHRYRDVLLLEGKFQEMVLGLFPPNFPNVYASYLTLTYGVGKFTPVPFKEDDFVGVVIYGHYVGEDADALFCTVDNFGDGFHQPKRDTDERARRLHITISLADGAKPGDIGLVDPSLIRRIANIPITMKMARRHLKVEKPTYVIPQAQRA